MDPRRRFLATLKRQPTDRLPLWDIEFHAWHAFGRGAPTLATAFLALPERQRPAAIRRNAGIIAEVAAELGMDAVTAPAPWWEDAPGSPAFYILPDGWDLPQAEALVEAARGRFAVVGNACGVTGARYDPDWCAQLVEDPEAVEADLEDLLQRGLERARRFAAAGCDAVVTASDIADNHGPFFRTDNFARFILPYLRRYAEAAHQLGLAAIMHSDGQLAGQLEDIAGSGIDALQAIDPVAGMSMPQCLDRVGQCICLCGNIDCALLLRGQPGEVAAATEALVSSCSGRGSWILGCTNAVLPGTPAGNYRAMAAVAARTSPARAA